MLLPNKKVYSAGPQAKGIGPQPHDSTETRSPGAATAPVNQLCCCACLCYCCYCESESKYFPLDFLPLGLSSMLAYIDVLRQRWVFLLLSR